MLWVAADPLNHHVGSWVLEVGNIVPWNFPRYLSFMNPNLRIFFKRSVYVLVAAALIGTLFYSLQNVIDWSEIGSYLMYGFMGFMMILMGVLITGVVVRTVWTGIMNRTDTIIKCYPDKIQDGVHLICSHYNPGGESTEGFNSYFHYYIDHKGKLYLSKKVDKDGDDLTRSLLHLAEQTRLQLDPDKENSKRIGSYSNDDKPLDQTMPVRQGELHFRGYEGLIDYGFKVSLLIGGQTRWRVRI
jgi:hypothetical protein